MSFYNMVFGKNSAAALILAALGLTQADVGRFRDAFVRGGKIGIYTRNGGGNRECWQWWMDENIDTNDCACPGCIITKHLPAHPLYLYDEDDDFDSTYATVWFRFPDDARWRALLEALDEGPDAPSQDERWRAYLERLKRKEIEPPPELKNKEDG